MTRTRALLLSIVLIFVLACNISLGAPAQPPAVQPTNAPPSTYTPLPTYTLQPAPAADTVTPPPPPAAVLPSPTSEILPKFASELIRSGRAAYGDTTNASDMWYFTAQAGQIFNATLSTDKMYQFFSLRDDTNDGLVGCDVFGNKTCSISNYKLPYTGLYYILVDRTEDERFKKAVSCTSNPPHPSWCYRGGPYGLTITIQ